MFFLALLPTVVDLRALTPLGFFELALIVITVVSGVLTTYALIAARARRLLTSTHSPIGKPWQQRCHDGRGDQYRGPLEASYSSVWGHPSAPRRARCTARDNNMRSWTRLRISTIPSGATR